jgi:hypothetical protein
MTMIDRNKLAAIVRFIWKEAEIKSYETGNFIAYAIIVWHPGLTTYDALTPLMPTEMSAWEFAAKQARIKIKKEAVNPENGV